ncbi:hypothetical protein ACPPVS_01470 [Cellulomonas sp. McL0617]|uniref:hypothetical protein n=1 Tax=Cellulomonas sp. McL0617 TaxID=3415675 RepID=UPI003CEF34E1
MVTPGVPSDRESRSTPRARLHRAMAWVASALSVVAAGLALLSLARPEWIEALFEASPDAGSGQAEWMVTLVLAAIAVVLAIAARVEWRRARIVPSRA